jgi:hypothetical protein
MAVIHRPDRTDQQKLERALAAVQESLQLLAETRQITAYSGNCRQIVPSSREDVEGAA